MNLEQMQETLAKVKTGLDKLKESAGEMNEMDKMRMEMMDSMYYALDYVHSRVNDLDDRFYNWSSTHMKGHIPAAKTASQMQHCLDVLGMDGDYNVMKPNIVMSAIKGNKVITARYNKPQS